MFLFDMHSESWEGGGAAAGVRLTDVDHSAERLIRCQSGSGVIFISAEYQIFPASSCRDRRLRSIIPCYIFRPFLFPKPIPKCTCSRCRSTRWFSASFQSPAPSSPADLRGRGPSPSLRRRSASGFGPSGPDCSRPRSPLLLRRRRFTSLRQTSRKRHRRRWRAMSPPSRIRGIATWAKYPQRRDGSRRTTTGAPSA